MARTVVVRAALALVVVTLGVSPGDGLIARAPVDPPKPADALAALNDASRAAYRRARDETLTRAGPIVLFDGDGLVLRRGTQRTAIHITPDTYQALKTISHVPLAIHSLLAGHGEGELDGPRLDELKQYRGLVLDAGKQLTGRGLNDRLIETQRQILDGSSQFLDATLEQKRVRAADLDAFLRRMRPLLEADATNAARAQIDALHRQMTAWQADLSADEWGRLRVVVMGSAAPRKDNLAVQYFARLLGETGEGGRVVYAEATFDETKALNLLAARELDAAIGKAVFADAERLHRDLLGGAARVYLDELFPKSRP